MLVLVFWYDLALAPALSLPALGVGVDLFFVISGYLVVARAARSIAVVGGLLRGAAAFWASRVIRRGVPAWVTIAGTGPPLASVWWALEGVRGEDFVAGAGLLCKLSIRCAWVLMDATVARDPLLSSHFWSLASEMQFYALAPFIAAFGRRSAWLITLAALAAGGGAAPWLLWRVLVGLATRRSPDRRSPSGWKRAGGPVFIDSRDRVSLAGGKSGKFLQRSQNQSAMHALHPLKVKSLSRAGPETCSGLIRHSSGSLGKIICFRRLGCTCSDLSPTGVFNEGSAFCQTLSCPRCRQQWCDDKGG